MKSNEKEYLELPQSSPQLATKNSSAFEIDDIESNSNSNFNNQQNETFPILHSNYSKTSYVSSLLIGLSIAILTIRYS